MSKKQEYKSALRNIRMLAVNSSHMITDRFDARWNDKSEFVSVSDDMRKLAKEHIINGQTFNSDKLYINGRWNNRLHYLLKQATKKNE